MTLEKDVKPKADSMDRTMEENRNAEGANLKQRRADLHEERSKTAKPVDKKDSL